MNAYFHFKQFSVRHHYSAMKVGTDGVLLGAWVDVNNVGFALDVGTGTGLIALMLAQRTGGKAVIDAVEINQQAAQDARENFKASPWPASLRLFEQPVQQFNATQRYDLIISNPPYFVNSLKPPDENRVTARHADSLTASDLIAAALSLLTPEGRLAVILPLKEGYGFCRLAAEHRLQAVRKCQFYSRRSKLPERWLMEFSTAERTLVEETLVLYAAGNQWSEEYIRLTKDFYLNI